MKYQSLIRALSIGVMTLILLLPPSLTYAQGSDEEDEIVKYTIKDYLETTLPPQEGRRIMLDEISGLLTITDTPKNQDLALKLIREWDVPPKQIDIEAKFIEITFTDLNEMGVDWSAYRPEHPIMSFVTGIMGDGSATSAASFTQAADMSGLGFYIGRAVWTGKQLFSYLKALEQSGKINLLNAPRIATLSGQMANIQVIRTFPYATSAVRKQIELSQVTSGVETKTVYPVETYEIEEEITGITLEVTPTVTEGSDIITLDIHPEVTKISQQINITSYTYFPTDLGWPVIDTRTAQTSVMVRSGETIILGGLIQDNDDDTIERKIPVLGDIPLVGNLFRYKYEKREKKNLVIFLTARLMEMK